MVDKEFLFSGLIRLHILYYASKEPIYGAGISEELERHGYKMSAGTLYPLLHGLEDRGLLRSRIERNGRESRRVYEATPEGCEAFHAASIKVRGLFGELFEEKCACESTPAQNYRSSKREG
jgi:PadR family transcriptional regulator, regulatory protein PadR